MDEVGRDQRRSHTVSPTLISPPLSQKNTCDTTHSLYEPCPGNISYGVVIGKREREREATSDKGVCTCLPMGQYPHPLHRPPSLGVLMFTPKVEFCSVL